MQNQETATESDDGGSSTLESLPAELLVNVFKYTRTVEDLQALRLVSRKFSQAATTALQNLYKTIAIMPTPSSMARFTSLAEHPLVAPSIEEVAIFFLPPRVAPKDVEAQVGDFRIYLTEHGVPEVPFNDFVSKFNDDCFDSRVIDSTALGNRKLSSVIESGDLERCLALGIKNFTALSYVQMFTDIRSPHYGADDLIFNLPLTPSILDRRNRYEYPCHTTAEHYLRCLALTHFYSVYLSWASPVDCIGALQNWPVTNNGRGRALMIGPVHAEMLAGQESADWQNWATKLNQNPHILHDYLSHVTLLSLSTDDGARRVFNWALTGEANNLRQQCASNWAQLLQSAENLTALRLQDESACQDSKFDNILHHVFTTCTWPALSELVIYRRDNMKLLPYHRNLFQCVKGWRLFRQQDMDAFLLRHKHTLQLLMLRNIVCVTERWARAILQRRRLRLLREVCDSGRPSSVNCASLLSISNCA